jgi:CPA2 family monovalent cation:H+ antiporter-2
MLDMHAQPWMAVDSDPDEVQRLKRAGKPVIYGDARRPELVDRLKLETAKAVVLTIDDMRMLDMLIRRIRERHPDLTVVVRARDADHAGKLYALGVTDAVPETVESSLQLAEAVLVDLGVPMGPVIASVHEKRDELRSQIKGSGAQLDEELLTLLTHVCRDWSRPDLLAEATEAAAAANPTDAKGLAKRTCEAARQRRGAVQQGY